MTSSKKTRLLRNSVIALLGSATLAFAASAATPNPNPQYGTAYQDPRVQHPDWSRTSAPPTGDLNIQTPVVGARIFVDGSFVGTTGQIQDIPVLPGSHNVEFRDAGGRSLYGASIAVDPGQVVQIRPNIGGVAPVGVLPNTGSVIIQMPNNAVSASDEAVFIDGRFMGMASQMSNIPLPAGSHTFELRATDGRVIYQNTVAVSSGQITNVRPTFETGSVFVPDSPNFIPSGASGTVKISSVGRNIAIFVDGDYVGTTNRMKDLVLTPGVHHLALADQEGQILYEDDVSVLSGKTTRIRPFNG